MSNIKRVQTDVLVIGGGMAAAQAAMEARRAGVQVNLVDLGRLGDSGSSPRSLVGFACAINNLDKERFFNDWCNTGKFIGDQDKIWRAVDRSRDALKSLEDIDVNFIKLPDGSYHLSRRAGHTAARGLMVEGGHASKEEIEAMDDHSNPCTMVRPTAEKLGVIFDEGYLVTKIIVKEGRACGAVAVNQDGEVVVYSAKAIVLAAGGANRFFPNLAEEIAPEKYGTYGASYWLAFNAGVPLVDMEFTQFRDSPPAGTIFGAPLLNNKGERFMERYAPDALEKAPRALVATAVYLENIEGRGPVVWHPDPERDDLLSPVLGPYRNMDTVEIVLQFQRCLGGAVIDPDARTPLPGLYAAGESSGSVLGADRMQSVAFLECVIYGMLAGQNAAAEVANVQLIDIEEADYADELAHIASFTGDIDPNEVIAECQSDMWEYAGVVKDEARLNEGIAAIEKIRAEMIPNLDGSKDLFKALEAETLAFAAECVMRSAKERRESRGCLNRSDYPEMSEKFVKHFVLNNEDGKIAVSESEVVVGITQRTWVK